MWTLLAVLLACTPKSESEAPVASPPPPAAKGGGEIAPPPPADAEHELSGTVLHRPWSKSTESWMAGGSDYYVLDVGGAPVQTQTADVGVILKPSGAVSAEEIAKHVDQNVVVRGVYVEAHVPEVDPNLQQPMGAEGEALPTGGGFEVRSIAPR